MDTVIKAKIRRWPNAVPSDSELEARFADLSMPEYPQAGKAHQLL